MRPKRAQGPSQDGDLDEVTPLLAHACHTRLVNDTAQAVEVPLRPGRDEGGKLTIPAHDSVELETPALDRYDVRAASGPLRQVTTVEPPVIVSNKTAHRIFIGPLSPEERGAQGLVIPAFGTRRVEASVLRHLEYRPWLEQNLVGVEAEEPPEKPEESLLGGLLGLGWLLVGALLLPRLGWSWGTVGFWVALLAGFPIFGALGVLVSTLRLGIFGALTRGINIVALVAVAAGVPLTATLVSTSAGLGVTLRSLPLGFRTVLVTVLALLPGLLYFQYERQRVNALREQLFREIMLLNPSIRVIDDARIMYGTSVDEVSGAMGADDRQFWLFGRGRPILLTTLFVAMGWIYAYQGRVGPATTLREALTVSKDVLTFAFLGAYFFAVQLLFRRYARGDLSPKVYSHIIVRLVCALIAGGVIGLLAGNGAAALAIAFLCGIVPETAVALAREAGRRILGRRFLPSLEEERPITDLEGVNLYDRVRLLEEGVENVENLAHHDLVELMLRSRIPTPRLVDLLDQAILYLHLRGPDHDPRAPLKTLRALGIRTASDLLGAWQKLDDDGAGPRAGADHPKRELLLGVLGPQDGKGPRALEVALCALRDDEWFESVLNWRRRCASASQTFTLRDFTTPADASAPGMEHVALA